MIKKLSLIMLTLFIMLSSANAVTTLTGCGKTSGWIDGETYILDFNEIPVGYLNNYCFSFNALLDNITIIGNNDDIIINANQDIYIFKHNPSVDVQNSDFLNFSFVLPQGKINKIYFNKLDTTHGVAGGGALFRYNNINNVKLKNFYSFVELDSAVPSLFGRMDYFGDNIINNSYIQTNYYTTTIGGVAHTIMNLNKIHNTYLEYNSISGNSYIYNTDTQNSIINGNIIFSQVNNIYTNSIVKNYVFLDSNDDNIGESANAQMVIPSITKQLFNHNFFQEFYEAVDIYSSYADNNLDNIFINNENVPRDLVFGAFTNPNGKDIELLGITIIDKLQGLVLLGGLNCDIITTDKCFIQDDGALSITGTAGSKMLIGVTNNTINNIAFNKIGTLNNANIISNSVDNYESGTTITNNNFNKSDTKFKGGDNYYINIKANNVLIKNNEFNSISTTGSGYEVLDIISNTPLSNQVTENIFTYIDPTNTANTEVFTGNSQTAFFNNFIGNDVVISETIQTDLVINVVYDFEYLGKIYYFSLGNYYESNTGCVDGNGDDICDSPYVNGAYTDNYPLAVYPYNYLGNLLNADYVINNNAFNISIIGLVQGENITLSTLNDDLIFQYSHDSEFTDLSCYNIIDGSTSSTDLNVPQNVIQNFTYTNTFTEKTYSYRVECGNAYQYIISEEFLFNIILDSVPLDPVNNETGGDSIYEETNIIGDTPSETSDNLVSWFGDMTGGIIGIAQTIGVFLFVVLIVGGVINLLS